MQCTAARNTDLAVVFELQLCSRARVAISIRISPAFCVSPAHSTFGQFSTASGFAWLASRVPWPCPSRLAHPCQLGEPAEGIAVLCAPTTQRQHEASTAPQNE